jgi:hypothetical protein
MDANAPITLSGAVFHKDELGNLPSLSCGDIKLYPKLDSFGKDALQGNHPNYGHSGYFRAAVYDGKKWRNFRFWDIDADGVRNFATAKERPIAFERLRLLLGSRSGHLVEWRTPAFRFPISEMVQGPDDGG